MTVSYHTRQALRRGLTLALAVGGALAVAGLCLLLWLQRFVVYTDQGVTLEFGKTAPAVQTQHPTLSLPDVTIYYDDTPFREGLLQISGYYIPEKALMDDPQAVQEKLAQLPAGTAVLLDVKGYRGYFFYSTQVGGHTSGLYEIGKMDSLLSWLAQSELYVIARMPALRDFVTVWDNNACGLRTAGGGLYSDTGDYGIGYWLDPSSTVVQNYLIDTLNELKKLGFDEVVLQDFRFPDSEDIAFSGDRAAALEQCARLLLDSCADSGFVLSFAASEPGFSLPDSQCRLYLQNIAPENAQSAWDSAAVEQKRTSLVFIASGDDTRYDIENGLLRPLA